jgi:hypothetical protein
MEEGGGAISSRDSYGGSLNTQSKPSEELEKLKESLKAARKYGYAEYLLRDRSLRDILCFDDILPKNLVTFRLYGLYRNLDVAEILISRLIELGLYELVVIDSYPTKRCKEECVRKKGRKCLESIEVCEDVTKDIYGLKPCDELLRVCSSFIKE